MGILIDLFSDILSPETLTGITLYNLKLNRISVLILFITAPCKIN